MHARAMLLVGILVGLAPACAGGRETELRDAVQAITDAMVNRDYAAVFPYVDSESREAIAKQLRDFGNATPGTPAYRLIRDDLQKTMDLTPEDLKGMSLETFFVEMFKGMDRAQPELRARQIEETRGRHVVGIEIDGDRAVVRTEAPDGPSRSDVWRFEDGGWKLTADEVGTGIDRK